MRLDGKVVLVTGAARGLGWGIARAFGQAGAAVCIGDVNFEELARSKTDLEGDGAEVLAVCLDVARLPDFQMAVDRVVARWGRLDVVVQNAAVMPLVRFEDRAPDSWWHELHVNLGGILNAARASWDAMKAQGGGHIMGIASGSSQRGYRDEVLYCAAKHGQEGFIKALALEAAPHRIAVNTVGPGKPIKPTGVTWDELERMPAARRAGWADPVTLGRAFVWLASQPPDRFSGLRFDAGPIADTLEREGPEFEFSPHKVTQYVDDFLARLAWQADYPG